LFDNLSADQCHRNLGAMRLRDCPATIGSSHPARLPRTATDDWPAPKPCHTMPPSSQGFSCAYMAHRSETFRIASSAHGFGHHRPTRRQ
jgi:hypothetical protein